MKIKSVVVSYVALWELHMSAGFTITTGVGWSPGDAHVVCIDGVDISWEMSSGQGAVSVSIWAAAAGAENIFFIMKPNENCEHKYLIFII
jgi:hypothetical protein